MMTKMGWQMNEVNRCIWLARLTEWILELIPETGWCIGLHLNERSVILKEDMVGGRERDDNRWRAGWTRDQIVKIAKLTGCKNFVGKRKKFMFNAFIDLKPVERFENGSDMWRFRSLNSASKRVLNLLEPVKLIVWKVVIERATVTVIEFSMDNGGGN